MTVKQRSSIMAIKPYTPGKPIEEVQREVGLDDIIKLASNENPLGPPPEAVKAIQDAAATVYLYPDGNCFYLKAALAKRYDITSEQIVIGHGSDEILELLAKAYLEAGDEVVIAEPTFSEYIFVSQLLAAVPVAVPVDKDYKHDLKAMLKAVTPKTKMIVLCNPNNPTGTVLGKREVADFIARVPANILVVFDAAYYEYVDRDADFEGGLSYALTRPNVILLRTFSKIYGLAGLRVGYGIADREVIAMLNRVREPFNVSLLAQKAAEASVNADGHVAAAYALNQAGKAYLYEQFTAMGLSYIPTQANFIMVDVRRNCREVFQALLKKGVIVRTGDIFGMPNYIRVTFGTMAENERFIRALKEVLS